MSKNICTSQLAKWPMHWSNKCVFVHKITNSSLKIKSSINRHVPMTFKINNQPNWKVHAILIEREKLFLVYHCISRHATCLFKSYVRRPIHFNYWLSRMSIWYRNISTETKKFHRRNNNEKLNDLFVC